MTYCPGTVEVMAVGLSGMGPCVLVADEADEPLRPAILYGIDTRAGRQIERLNNRYGAEEILRRCGSALSSQAVGPNWHGSQTKSQGFSLARRLYMPSSWLVRGCLAHVLDHHSASQCTPLYDTDALDWYWPWAEEIALGIDLPPLGWPGDAAGTVTLMPRQRPGCPRASQSLPARSTPGPRL